MTARLGITAYGAYLPRLRLARAAIADAHAWAIPNLPRRGSRAMAAWDEDAVTMATEAARQARAMIGGTAPAWDALTLASTTMPFADRLNAGIVATALDLQAGTLAQDATGSLRAASTSLLAALVRNNPGCIAAGEGRPTQPGSPLESTLGDAGAAIVVGAGPPLAECLGWATENSDFIDHYRGAEAEADYVLEERWTRDAAITILVPRVAARALEAAGLASAAVDIALLATPPGLAAAAATAIGLPRAALRDAFSDTIGHAGAAHPLLMLAEALESARPGQIILLVAFGSGCDALVLRATELVADRRPPRPIAAQLAEGQEETRYLRFLSANRTVRYAWGIRAERDNRTAQTVAWRKSRDVTAFVGGHCRQCGTVQFPRARVCVAPNCRAIDTQDPHPLADGTGRIKTFTEDWQAFTPDPPLRYGNIGFAEGGNALMEIADCPPAGLAIGQPVRFAFRVKDHDERRDFRRYFWKAVPMQGGA